MDTKDVEIQALKKEAEFWKNQFMQLVNVINIIREK